VGEHLAGLESFHCDRVSFDTIFLECLHDVFRFSQSKSREPVGKCNSVVDRSNSTCGTRGIDLKVTDELLVVHLGGSIVHSDLVITLWHA